MTVPPIECEHVVSAQHFVAGVVEYLLHGAYLEHFLNMNLFKPSKILTLPDKEGEGGVARLITIGIDVLPNV